MNKLKLQNFIEKARIVHGLEYDYGKVDYKSSKSKVTIICSEHGEFLQSPYNHLLGRGCIKCSINSRKLSSQNFIEKSRIVHGLKYDYSKVDYVNSNTKVTIICPEHGEFLQRPYSHLIKQGCMACGVNSKKLSLPDFIEKARIVHGLKYDYSKVDYVNCYTNITIICPEHGEITQRPSNHLFGKGCNKCAVNSKKAPLQNFIEKARIAHGLKYDYNKVDYVNCKTKVTIICPEHGEFLQVPLSHLQSHGCKKCAINSKKLSFKML